MNLMPASTGSVDVGAVGRPADARFALSAVAATLARRGRCASSASMLIRRSPPVLPVSIDRRGTRSGRSIEARGEALPERLVAATDAGSAGDASCSGENVQTTGETEPMEDDMKNDQLRRHRGQTIPVSNLRPDSPTRYCHVASMLQERERQLQR